MHYRAALRTALKARLTGLATTGDRVYVWRSDPYAANTAPGLDFRIDEPEIRASTVNSPRVLERELRVSVRGAAKAMADVDITLDAIGEEVEIALAAPLSVAGNNVDLELREARLEVDQAEMQAGTIQMTYACTVFTAHDAPHILL